ncbi:MAG: IS607 family transposase [Ignavibacteriae bacterium]|nr:IS607 family transposase [Ignavibacteriota bacterium]
MTKFLSIGKAAKELGVAAVTLRRWGHEGKLIPAERTLGKQRRYDISQIKSSSRLATQKKRATIAYARVSSHDQKADLERQKSMLEMYCAANGWSFDMVSGLRRLLSQIIEGNIERLVLTYKDRLLCFGAELVFSICETMKTEVVIINQGDTPSFEEELAQDVLEIITVFSARLYGSRSHKNKQLIDSLQKAVEMAHA